MLKVFLCKNLSILWAKMLLKTSNTSQKFGHIFLFSSMSKCVQVVLYAVLIKGDILEACMFS